MKHKLMKKPTIQIINSFYSVGRKIPGHWQHLFVKSKLRYDPPSET